MTTYFEPSIDVDAAFELTPPAGLDQSNLVDPVKAPPKQGWRKLVHSVTRGRINPGGSRQELEQQQLFDAIRAPLRGDYRIAVMSLKGGVGKTTTTVALGGVFAQTRGDRVIAIDANPDLGTLAQRAAGDHPRPAAGAGHGTLPAGALLHEPGVLAPRGHRLRARPGRVGGVF